MFHDASADDERAKGGIGADFTRLRDVFLITALNANAAAIDEVVAAIAIAHRLANNALIGTINHRLIIGGRNVTLVDGCLQQINEHRRARRLIPIPSLIGFIDDLTPKPRMRILTVFQPLAKVVQSIHQLLSSRFIFWQIVENIGQ